MFARETPLCPAQQALVASALHVAKHLAKRFAREHGGRLPEDELRAIGYEALVDAAQSFDSSHGVAFEAFAAKGVRGAMRDALARERLRGRVDRGEGVDDGGAGARIIAEAVAGRPARSPEELLHRGLERARRLRALEHVKRELSRDEQRILRNCFEGDLDVKRAAADVGLSYKTARKLRDRALRWMRARLRWLGVTESVRPSWEPVSDRCR
jgi:RNA polymerase sigma factor (sigma-70 family)